MTVKKFGASKIFFFIYFLSLMFTKPAFMGSKYSKNCNIVKY